MADLRIAGVTPARVAVAASVDCLSSATAFWTRFFSFSAGSHVRGGQYEVSEMTPTELFAEFDVIPAPVVEVDCVGSKASGEGDGCDGEVRRGPVVRSHDC
jgi:hypothetical protein